MISPREKALTQFPAMYITLVSVVQAIALEVLISRWTEIRPTLTPEWSAAVIWLEILLLGQTVFYVWVSYTLLVTLAQWVFRVVDFGSAFGVGVIELVAIGWIGEGSTGAFLVVVGVGFVGGAIITHSNTGAAAGRAENVPVMALLPRGRVISLLGTVGVLGFLGAALHGWGGAGAMPVAVVLAGCNLVLAVAQLQWFGWWRRALEPEEDGPAEAAG